MAASASVYDSSITVVWDSVFASELARSADGGATWEVIADGVTGGHYTDASATPGVAYLYRVRVGGEEWRTGEVWILPCWGWNTVTQVFTANDCVNRPTCRARILDSTSRAVLRPEEIESVSLTVFDVLDCDVTWKPRFDRITGMIEVGKHDCLLPNLVADELWPDDIGFNFSHTPPIDLDPGDYAFRYCLRTVGGTEIYVHFRYTSKCRRA